MWSVSLHTLMWATPMQFRITTMLFTSRRSTTFWYETRIWFYYCAQSATTWRGKCNLAGRYFFRCSFCWTRSWSCGRLSQALPTKRFLYVLGHKNVYLQTTFAWMEIVDLVRVKQIFFGYHLNSNLIHQELVNQLYRWMCFVLSLKTVLQEFLPNLKQWLLQLLI